jgi:internalin A
MRGRANVNIWLVTCCLAVGITGMVDTSLAEEPVYFADTNLKAAVEEALNITNPTPTDMLALTELVAEEKNINNLSGIENAANMQYLNLNKNDIFDINVLSVLTNLTELDLGYNQIVDINPLSNLTNLTKLRISENLITDIIVLSNLTNLTQLRLDDNRIRDISAIAGLTNLTELWLQKNNISDISAVAGLTNLTDLWLYGNDISDISAVAGLTNLTMLYLASNDINDISPIAGLSNLTRLFLESNQISDLSPLSGLTNLDYLRLHNNQISDISGLAGLANLTWLDLERNQISDVSGLAGLSNLRHLRLNDNQISDITVIAGLTSIWELILHHNQISDISGLAVLKNLAYLNLSYNQISDISAVAWLNLVSLVLENNHVSDISAISVMTNLLKLDLRGNPLNQDAYYLYIPLIAIRNPWPSLYYDERKPTLTIVSTAGGSIDVPGEGVFAYDPGSSVPIMANADPGYHFVNWTGTAVDAGKVEDPNAANTTVTVDADCTLQAIYVARFAIIYVDDDAADDPGPNNPAVSDRSENGTLAHPFDTIREGIDAAMDGDVVQVYPGLYREEINFLGKPITVQGIAVSPAGVPVIQNPGDFAVSFYSDEGVNSILKNFIIKDSFMGVLIVDSSPTISNLTIADNKYGIDAYADSAPDISNCILWNNIDGDLFGCRARYSCMERCSEGEGNISDEPLFVDPENGDYHIRSERGRYWPQFDIWALDKVTSPCIDGGDPDTNTLNEPMPHGGRINIGAYGGTIEASLSPWQILPSQASVHYPRDGEYTDNLPIILAWTPGQYADLHDVYFGTDYDAVANATTESIGIYCGRQSVEMTTYDPGILELNKTYYWRIDEVIEADPGSPSKGSVWSFTTAGFIVLDDFEGYGAENKIWLSWHDGIGYGVPGTETYIPANGTGAAVGDEMVEGFMETFIVHSGRQSLPYYYDNNKPGCLNYSEATLILDHTRDWKKEGIEVLSLWFYGDPANIPEPMYMAVDDAKGQTAIVLYHDNPNSLLMRIWTEWTIDLQEFADKGVNLTDVNSITIGFGYRKNPQPGGSAKIYFDDIRLRRP